MSISITIPKHLAKPLANLFRACDQTTRMQKPLAHIAVTVADGKARFAATDGKMLAVVVITEEVIAGNVSIIVDAGQFTDAMAKAVASHVEASLVISDGAVSCTVRGQVMTIATIEGIFPQFESVIAQETSKAWIPVTGWLAFNYLDIARKIVARKAPLFFCSSIPRAEDGLVRPVQDAFGAKAFWSDGEILILIMPVSCRDAPPVNVAPFLMNQTLAVAV